MPIRPREKSGIRQQPEGLFEMMRSNVQENVGQCLSELMETELTGFLGRDRYVRLEAESNHRNGSYGQRLTLQGIGGVAVTVPRDRKGQFKTQVIPRSRQYEDSLREDLCGMFLAGVSTRTLALMSERLLGRKVSAMEVSNAGRELTRAVEAWRERDLSVEPIKYLYLDGTFSPCGSTGQWERFRC